MGAEHDLEFVTAPRDDTECIEKKCGTDSIDPSDPCVGKNRESADSFSIRKEKWKR
jgi:hypothetical protein